MRIEDVLFAPGHGGFFNDDQAAIKAGAGKDGCLYLGSPVTAGFETIRMPAAALGIGLRLSDRTVVWGDMMTVQYSGVGGREARFDPSRLGRHLKKTLVPSLVGLEVTTFRALVKSVIDGANLGPSVAYGLTQALLRAVAATHRQTVAEIVCGEYGFPLIAKPVRLYCQSGDDRKANVDKMILRRANVLPHGLINQSALVGPSGEAFSDYARWVADRILAQADEGYRPTLHFDVYGGIGDAFNNECDRIADYLCRLGENLRPFAVQIEAVADFGSRQGQIEGFCAIRRKLRERGSCVMLVADEWCNTLKDIKAFNNAGAADLIQLKMPDIGSLDDTILGLQSCREAGVGTYLGGSCTETDLSARISVQIGVAAQVDMLLAKPGMGVDEGYMIVANEQARLLASLRPATTQGVDSAPAEHSPARAKAVVR